MHLICDNYATHKTPPWPSGSMSHPRFHMHHTPTYSSWLNQVERWFGLLTDKQLRRGAHRSIQALEKDIRDWIKNWNENPKPFAWNKTADEILERLASYLHRILARTLGGCDIGVSYTLPRIVGAGPAFDLILTARVVDADEALRLGMVSRVSLDDSVVDDALAIAETLCGYGKFGVESTKQVLWANLDAASLEAALHLENRSQILASTGGVMGDATEAFRHRQR